MQTREFFRRHRRSSALSIIYLGQNRSKSRNVCGRYSGTGVSPVCSSKSPWRQNRKLTGETTVPLLWLRCQPRCECIWTCGRLASAYIPRVSDRFIEIRSNLAVVQDASREFADFRFCLSGHFSVVAWLVQKLNCTQPAKKRGLPTPKVMNRLTPLLEPASEKAQGGKCPLAPPEMSILILCQSEYG